MTLRKEKLGLFTVLTAAVAAVYLGTAHATLFEALLMPVTALDRMIPFSEPFVVVYVSLFALIPLPLLVISDRRPLRDAVFGFCLIVAISCVAFLFWPTAIPDVPSNPWLRDLLAFDTARNACPSLHASLAVYCGLWSGRQLTGRVLRYGLSLWVFMVVASALLIERHVVIDVVVGALLGWTVFFVVTRPAREESADTEPVVETVRIRRSFEQRAPREIAGLSRHELGKRLGEFAVFVPLATIGVSLSVYARTNDSTPLLLAGIFVTAVSLNAFVLLMHEGMHGALFRSRRWNGLVSFLLGATFLMSFSSYRVMHIRHHRYLGDPRDPDDYKNYSRNAFVVWALHFVRLTIGSLLYLFLIPLLALKYGSPADRKRICLEYACLFVIYSTLLRLVPAQELLVVWLMPLLLVGAMTAIRGFTQHGITDAADPYLASRTILPNPVVEFLLLGENYHLEHHLFPEVPSYQLRGLHRLIWPKLPRAVSGTSYLGFLFAFLRATPRMDETPIGFVKPGDSSQ